MTRRSTPSPSATNTTDTGTNTETGTLPAFTPVPRQYQRYDGWTEERQRRFIEALADTGSVEAATKAVNMSRRGAYHLRRQPGAASFRKAWEAALQLGVQRVEDVAMDRALNGVEVPVYSYGKLVGQRTVYNDRLLMFILRNRAPERFAAGRPLNGGSLKRGPGGMGAVGRMELRRLKTKWRAQWDAEREREAGYEHEEQVLASIDKKLDRARNNWLGAMSPRARAAWDHFNRLQQQDKDADYNPWTDPDHKYYIDPTRRKEDKRGGAKEELKALPAPEGDADGDTRGDDAGDGAGAESDADKGPRIRTF